MATGDHWHVWAGTPPKGKPRLKIPTALLLVEAGFHSPEDAHKLKRQLERAGKYAKVIKCWHPTGEGPRAACGVKMKRRYADTERDDALTSPGADFVDVPAGR